MMALAGDEKGGGKLKLGPGLVSQPPTRWINPRSTRRGFQRHPRDRQPLQPKGLPDQLFALVICSYQVIVSLPSRIS
jgi:hypothetical protein